MLLGGTANADEKSLVSEANSALAQKDYKTAVAKFTQLAEQGKATAQFNLGAFYLNGQGVQKDDKQAFEWFRKSAAQGNARAQQVIEKAAAQGNVYAVNELKLLKGMAEPAAATLPPAQKEPEIVNERPQPKPQEKPQEIVQEKPQPKPQFRGGNKPGQYRLVNGDPTVAAAGKWVFGISAEYSRYKATEPLYYPVGGLLSSVTQSYSTSQPGLSAWLGYGDITVTASFRKRTGSMAAPAAGAILSKSFRTTETEFEARWLLSQLSADHFVPYAVAGIGLGSTSGTGNEVDFQDIYSQKDTILMLGAGAIVPIDEKIGFRVEGRLGADKQKSSGSYVANPGVTLSFASYSYTATANYSRLNASMYFKIDGGWNAQLGYRRGHYAAGIGPAFGDTAIYASVGYVYR